MTTTFELSNIAMLSSALNQQVKFNAAQQEVSWKGVGSQVGVEVFRIEQFQVKKLAANQATGSFYSGDCYIVLNTYKPSASSDRLAYNLHFWLGKDSTQDEQGTAAYKATELDDYLGGVPVQYREVQHFESPQFTGLFPHLIYLNGGVASGFRHVEAERYNTRLLQVCGNKPARCIDVTHKGIALQTLNDSDVFILDDGLVIYQFFTPKCSLNEKTTSTRIVQSINEERNCKAEVVVIDGLKDGNVEFWQKYFKLSTAPSTLPTAADQLQASTQQTQQQKKTGKKSIIRLKADSGKLEVTTIVSGADELNRCCLSEDDVFLIDSGAEVLYVFVGSKASVAEKVNAMSIATEYLKANKMPTTTAIVRCVSGSESKEFQQLFQ